MGSLITEPQAVSTADSTCCGGSCSDGTDVIASDTRDATWSGVIDPLVSVRAVVSAHPAAVSIFHTFGIDTCCGAGASLRDAAKSAGADLESVLISLDAQFGSHGATRPG